MLFHTKSEEGDKVIQIEKSSDLFRICPLYANMPPSEQAKAFVKYPNQRKIVLATNIAETSVTIPGIKYVVDSGLQKLKTFQAVSGVECL